jgi:alkaline phosphatase
MKKITIYSLALLITFSLIAGMVDAKGFKGPRARNIIFMVPDGMGLSNVTSARIFVNGPDGEPLDLETLPQIGYQRTHSANSTVTDSAAAASAWACGEKYDNNEVSCHDIDNNYICDEPVAPTVLEVAKAKGKATGLVATSTITHATPAVWGAHVYYRNCETEIARQLVLETGVDVLLGGGFGGDRNCMTPSPLTVDEIIAEAQDNGYAYVTTRDEMTGTLAGKKTKNKKMLGLFTPAGKTPEMFRVDPAISYPENEPTLPEMTQTALDILEKDRQGFFLMVEGSQIDWANHANDVAYQTAEMIAFDESVKVVLDWVNARPVRKLDTLVIIVADHDCGGFAVNGPYGVLSMAGDLVEDGWTSSDHTAQDTIVWSQGPNSDKLGKALDNTDLYYVMVDALK